MRLYLFREDTTFVEVTSRAVIGRSFDCDLVIPSDTASRKHAEVIREGDACFISDLGSSGGMWLGDRKRKIINPHRIADGERYSVGTTWISATLRESALQSPVTLALEDSVAELPTDPARRRVWIDALIERSDPLGAWLRAPRSQTPRVTSRGPVELSWEEGLIRTAVVNGQLAAGEEVLRSRLATHLLELIVDGSGSLDHERASFLARLEQTRLPALQHVRLRGFGKVPKALPLAPRLRSLEA